MIDVDVIIPFHRDIDRYLLEAITSVEESVGVNPRIILVNDQPNNISATDFLLQRGYEVITSSGGGYSACLNLGVQYSSSQFVAQLNSDDLHHPNRLSRQIGLMLNSNSSLSITRLQKFGGKRAHYELSGKQPEFTYDKSLLFLGAYGANASVIFDRSFLLDKFWEPVEMADWKFAFDNYPSEIAFLDEPLYYYRMHLNQISRIKSVTPDWLELCWKGGMMKELGRELSASKSLVEAISLPGRLPILQRKDFKEMHEVFEYLMLKNISKNVDYIKGYNSLLMRRLIIAAAKNGQWQEIAKFTGLFGRPALVKEICKMGVEFSRYYRVARR